MEIQADGAPVRVLVIPTNEELEIALQCFQAVGGSPDTNKPPRKKEGGRLS